MRRSALWGATLAAALTGPAPLAGQSARRIEIVPRAGVTASANEGGRLVRHEDYASRVGGDDGGSSERPRPGDPPASRRRSGGGRIVHQLALSIGARLPVY